MTSEVRPNPAGERHPARKELQRLMKGELSRVEARVVVRHLLRSCPICTRETRKLWHFGEEKIRPLPETPPLPDREVRLWR